jgi:lipid-A-disaccharide synthase-like uncharacterized protein
MKWQPVASMLVLLALALWLVLGGAEEGIDLPEGAHAVEVRIGTGKGWLEVQDRAELGCEFRMRYLGVSRPQRALTSDELALVLGQTGLRLATEPEPNWAFRLLNITSWAGLAWVMLGMVGQALFFARLLVQWLASERRQQSIVPVQFWWYSLLGGAMLFAYFVWRRDIVGVLGQTTGVVIYARNLRLIYRGPAST